MGVQLRDNKIRTTNDKIATSCADPCDGGDPCALDGDPPSHILLVGEVPGFDAMDITNVGTYADYLTLFNTFWGGGHFSCVGSACLVFWEFIGGPFARSYGLQVYPGGVLAFEFRSSLGTLHCCYTGTSGTITDWADLDGMVLDILGHHETNLCPTHATFSL